MTAAYGKLEALIKVPSGTWGIRVTDTGGTASVSVAAGNYYLSSGVSGGNSFLAALAAALNASGTLNGTYTITAGLSNGGTGRCTIACTEAFTVAQTGNVWDVATGADEVQDLLGFNGQAITAVTSATGDDHCESVWLPDNFHWTEYGDGDDGYDEIANRGTEAPDGTCVTFAGSRKTVQAITWNGISLARTRIAGESTSGESYQRFFRDWMGDGAWSLPGRVRYYPDASVDATYSTYHYSAGFTNKPDRFVQDLTGFWIVRLDRLVLQS